MKWKERSNISSESHVNESWGWKKASQAHEVGVNDEQTGAEMEKKKKKGEAARNPLVKHTVQYLL